MKPKNKHKYERHSIVDTEKVLSLVRQYMMYETDKAFRINVNGQQVKINSLRLQTFATSGIKCKCGKYAHYFAIERSIVKNGRDPGPFHLNLWHLDENDEEILFTHDHIKARCFGGADKLHNTQTMCTVCNGKKGHKENLQFQAMKQKLLNLKGKLK